MDTYIKTIINGLKTWVTSCLTRLESSVSGSLHSMADKLTSLSTKVQQAQTTATQAQTTATQAQTTATQAQTTATQAQTTAQSAQATANTAKTTANTAKTTANTAETTATAANTKANANDTNIKKATCEPGVFYLCYGVGTTGEMLHAGINALCDKDYTSDGFFIWIAKFAGTASSVQVAGVSFMDAGNNATFGESVTVNKGDIIRIYKGANDNAWKAELTGINLDYQALDTAYTEGVNSL